MTMCQAAAGCPADALWGESLKLCYFHQKINQGLITGYFTTGAMDDKAWVSLTPLNRIIGARNDPTVERAFNDAVKALMPA
jgi:hypothetical protein